MTKGVGRTKERHQLQSSTIKFYFEKKQKRKKIQIPEECKVISSITYMNQEVEGT